MRRFALLLAGGSGKRLWPISTQERPKQLVPFRGTSTLLECTSDFIAHIFPEEQRVVVTTEQYAPVISDLMDATSHAPIGRMCIEPCARNTAAAILFAVEELLAHNNDALVCIFPTDHSITPQSAFEHDIMSALDYAQTHNAIILFGIAPTYPATGFGYIARDASRLNDGFYHICGFHEKPSFERAQHYCHDAKMLWNCGIVCARASIIRAEAEQYAPQILDAVRVYRTTRDRRVYESIPEISFDRAIIEKSQCCVVREASFSWSDVGTPEAFRAAQEQFEKRETASL